MNKLELIETLKNEAGIGKKEAAAAVKLFFDKMADTLASGDRVEIRGPQSIRISGRLSQPDPKRLPQVWVTNFQIL